jgi:hypothetical protein
MKRLYIILFLANFATCEDNDTFLSQYFDKILLLYEKTSEHLEQQYFKIYNLRQDDSKLSHTKATTIERFLDCGLLGMDLECDRIIKIESKKIRYTFIKEKIDQQENEDNPQEHSRLLKAHYQELQEHRINRQYKAQTQCVLAQTQEKINEIEEKIKQAEAQDKVQKLKINIKNHYNAIEQHCNQAKKDKTLSKQSLIIDIKQGKKLATEIEATEQILKNMEQKYNQS